MRLPASLLQPPSPVSRDGSLAVSLPQSRHFTMMAAAAAVATTAISAAVLVRRRSSSSGDPPQTPQGKKVAWAPHDPTLPATPKARGDPGTDKKNGNEPLTVREALDQRGGTKHVTVPKAKKRLSRELDEVQNDDALRRSKRQRTAKKR